MNDDPHLIVALSLPGRDRPLLCIPHGAGGLMGADDLDRIRHRIERVAEHPEEAEQVVHLTWHAFGSIAARVSLVGASVAPVNALQFAMFDALSRADRQVAETRPPTGLLSLDEALALVGELHLTPEQCTALKRVAVATGAGQTYPLGHDRRNT